MLAPAGRWQLTASELVSISGAGSGLFSTASSTGNAGQITVSAPGFTPVPTLTMADGGKISVETSFKESGAGSAGSVSLNANTFSLAGGAQVVSSTSGSGQGGSVTATATQSMSISGGVGASERVIQHGVEHRECGQITVSAPALAPVPTLTMADGGTISVATGERRQCWQHLTQCQQLYSRQVGRRLRAARRVVAPAGRWQLTASELVSISGAGSGLFSTASSTGNAGQITVSAPGSSACADVDDGRWRKDFGCDIGSRGAPEALC